MIQHNANGLKDIKKLPFDIEKALAGHPLVTRDGEMATDFKKRIWKTIGNCFHYSAIINSKECSYTRNGKYYPGKETEFDLFLLDTSKSETMENNKELTLLEKFNAGWEIKAYGFKIVDVVQWKNGEHTAMDSDGTVWQYENHESHFTITTPVERRWVNLCATSGGEPYTQCYDKKEHADMDKEGYNCTDQFTIIKTENGWKLEGK